MVNIIKNRLKITPQRRRNVVTWTTILSFLAACLFMAFSEKKAMASWIDRGMPFSGDIYALVTAPDGTIWAGGKYGSTARWNGESWEYMGTWPYSADIKALGVTQDGSIWAAGTYGYTARWNGTTWEAKGQALGDNIYALTVAQDGSVWVAGLTGDVARWNGSAWENIGKWPYTSTTINDLVTGLNGYIWAGGASGCTAYWNGNAWVETGQVSQPVYALTVAHDGSIWAAGSSGSVYRWNGTTWESRGPWIDNTIIRALAAQDGFVWAGDVYGSVARWNGSTWEDMGTWPPGMIAIYAMTTASDGTVWVAGAGGHTAQYTPVDVGTPQLSFNQDGPSVILSWTAAQGADLYELQRSTDGSNYTRICETTQTIYTDTLTGQGTFYYRVRGKTSLGFVGAFSNVVYVTYNPPPPPPPPEPATLTAYWIDGKIRVEWDTGDDPSPSGTVELVRQSYGSSVWLPVKTLTDAEKTNFIWDDLMTLAGLNYQYQLRSLGGLESDYNWQVIAESGWATGDRPFSSPSGLRVSLGQSSATVTWEAVSGATSYTIQYSTDGGTTWQTFSVTGTSATVPRHCLVRVRAGSHPRSQWSGIVTVN